MPGQLRLQHRRDPLQHELRQLGGLRGGQRLQRGVCVAPTHVGTCTENDDCYSKVCGVNGTGHCCFSTTPCTTGDAQCGASDCDPIFGSCNYADAGTACGSVAASCNDNLQQSPSVCDGKGTCPAPAKVPCSPYVCGPTACLTTCADDTACGTGDFCDLGQSSCCPGLTTGDSVNVDATGGNDALACCSLPGYQPCQTLARTMSLIDNARAKGVIINAAVRQGSTWNPPGEVYPIVLGWGVELKAPGVFFYDANANPNPEIIDIAPFSKNDTVGYASLVGSTIAPVSIGMDEFRDQATDKSAIQVEAGNTLYLANALVNGSDGKASTAITVAAGGTLVLAQDKSGGVTGTVTIGNTFNISTTNGYKGIVCGTGKSQGCTISDAALKGGASSLVIEGQEYIDIDAEDYAVISLTSAPVIGLPPAKAGFLECVLPSGTGTTTAKPDVSANSNSATSTAVLLNGLVNMTFNNGTVQCIEGDGFLLNATANGSPTLTLVGTTIQNTEFGVKANAGNATISSSTIQYNFNGVEQGTDGTNVSSLDLSSGGDGGTTTVACSSSYESIHGRLIAPGVSVINTTSTPLDAQNVDWDTAGPDLFSCNSTLTNCSCEISSCSVSVADAGLDGLDAVYTSGGTVDTSGAGTTSLNCTAPVRTVPSCSPLCTSADYCCGSNECCARPAD